MPSNLPLNWCECKLEDFCYINLGQSPSSDTYNNDKKGIPFFQGKADFGRTYPTVRCWCSSPNKIAEEGDVLLSVRAPVGAVNIANEKCCIGRGLAALRGLDAITNKFMYYLILAYERELHKQETGTTFAAITGNALKNIDILLPPLAEQERIVEKIEALFQDIDEGVERLKSAQAQIKQYRQSVLKSAFEGKLYKTTDWKEVQLKDVCEKITDGSHFSPKQVSDGCYPYITVKDVRKDIIDFDAAKRIDKKQYELLLKAGCKPYKGDVLFSKDGTVGKVVLVDYEKEFVILSSLAILRPKKELKSEFLFYVLKSPKFLAEAINKKTGVAIRRIILDTLKRISISFPSDISVQQRIVAEIEKHFAVADVLEKAVNEGLEKADKLKQSILKKAFEGKLAPQNPNDEPASVLLERIKKEQIPTKGKKK